MLGSKQLRVRAVPFEAQGKPFDPHETSANPRLGSAEIWNFVNDSGDWAHAVQVPLEAHQVLSRNGIPPAAAERARQDMVWLGRGESVKTIRRFRDFLGRYPTTCADAPHADHAMMFMWSVRA